MRSVNDKIADILACPRCKTSIRPKGDSLACDVCGIPYEMLLDKPTLIMQDSPVKAWFDPHASRVGGHGVKGKLVSLWRSLMPSERVWTRKSQALVRQVLEATHPDSPDSHVVLIGAGFEPVYKRLLSPYSTVIRVGLAHREDVDVVCDICDLPLAQSSVDLILSSSVLEHVYDPERAVDEMFKAIRPNGYVYAEIPFMRAYHMIPVDYQRYTISGIASLFGRHGFTEIESGICSGPFTGLALFLRDFCGGLFSFSKPLEMLVVLGLYLLLHPMKYLDRLCENSRWARINACNFYYLGKKNSTDGDSAASLTQRGYGEDVIQANLTG